MYDIIFIGSKEHSKWHELKSKFPTAKQADTFEKAQKKSLTKMFWAVYDDLNIANNWNFTYEATEFDNQYIHVFKNGDNYDGIALHPKNHNPSDKEVRYRFYVNKKEVDIVASTPSLYDLFSVSTFEDYEHALANTTTEMFWIVFPYVDTCDFGFDMYFTHGNSYDRNQNHTFLHDDNEEKLRNSVWLCTKNKPLSKKEIEYRFALNAKEWDIIASKRKPYEKFDIITYEDYLSALETATTEMFWIVFCDVKVKNDFNFNIYFPAKNLHDKETEYDRNINHTFLHDDNGEKLRNGVWLCSTHTSLGRKEVEYRFAVNAKEHDIVASERKLYDIFDVHNYNDYVIAREKSTTEMFWIMFDNVEPTDDFKFDMYFPKKHMHDKLNEYDLNINHTFLHKDKDTLSRNGIWLCSKAVGLGKKEVDYRFAVNAKEHEVIASKPKLYQQFHISNYEDYLKAYETSETEMFWAIPKDVEVVDNSIFTTYYPYKHLHDIEHKFDREINHVYKNGEFQDGVILCSKLAKISQREWDYGFIVNKKEVPICASKPNPFDIVFISYNEIDADRRYTKLCKRFPNAKWVHGIKGIHQAHIAAAKLCDTSMFWVVDGDAVILDDFDFDFQVPRWEHDMVHVWRSQNPITGMEYGYGGVKLLPKQLTIDVNVNSTDMTTSISSKFKAVPRVSNITQFNTDAFSTWRSAFRECVKLTLNDDAESMERLEAWLHPVPDAQFRHDAKAGAEQGREYAKQNSKDAEALARINDFDWLREQYESRT